MAQEATGDHQMLMASLHHTRRTLLSRLAALTHTLTLDRLIPPRFRITALNLNQWSQ